MTEEFDNIDDSDMNDDQDDKFEESLPIEEISSDFDEDITDDDKLWALLAYVITPLIPIILLLLDDKKDRPFIKAHNAQALAWGLITLVAGTFLSFLLCIPWILLWGVGVYWGWQAYQGEYVTIPVITDFVKGQGWA